MVRLISFVIVALAVFATAAAPAAAKQAAIDPAFSDSIISTLGYPEVNIDVTPEGVTAPSTLAEGYYLVTLSTVDDFVAYLDIMQPPAGLSDQEIHDLALGAGNQDIVQPDWVYVGGTNTPNPGETASFIVYLRPGDYRWAASYYSTDDNGENEVMRELPLTVTPAATPVASPAAVAEPPATVTLEATDELRYVVTPGTVPAGPQIWKIANTGMHHAHHVVMMRVPDGTTAEAVIAEYTGMMTGTPPAADGIVAQSAWVAYAALQSGGQTTWAEFDLAPGTYAAICFIFDPTSGRPHLLDGMVTVFQVA